MGIIDHVKGLMNSGSSDLNELWNTPQNPETVDEIVSENSGNHLIYKHSYSCGVCYFSKNKIESSINDISARATLHFIDVKNARNISDYIAEQTGITHESPQVIVLKNGKPVWHSSHGSITAEGILESLQ